MGKANRKRRFVGVDLFAGAGGLSLGARLAGIDVRLAVENDPYAAATYARNHPSTRVIVDDVRNVKDIDLPKKDGISILFGGPPCQGFSTSNQRTRNTENEQNWLFLEFLRIARIWEPDWVVFENVRGIIETEKGAFRDRVQKGLETLGYTCSPGVLCAADFGVPQLRSRFFLIASRHGVKVEFPTRTARRRVTVRQAIGDLPKLENGAEVDYLAYPRKARSRYAQRMRNGQTGCHNHLVTNNAPHIIKRYKHIPQGGNWEDIPEKLMRNYTDRSRCHTGIYRRLREDRPSVVLGNYRKNMLIHPRKDRGLSVREAARLQSFPDSYEFQGSVGFQQQQVANAVPPLLSAAVFRALLNPLFPDLAHTSS
jgi:DNA (cytosine-5)-methyltransferase 1